MPSTTLNSRRLILLIAMGLALAVALTAVAIVAGQARQTNHSQGTAFGKARISADDDVVLRVNGYAIANAELIESRLRYYRNLASMRSAVERAVPADKWGDAAAPNANFASNDPRSPVHEYMITDGFTAYIGALEKHGGDVVGLAALVADYAEFSAAIDAGHSASVAEVAEYVEMTRDALNRQSASEWGMLPEMRGYIDAVGENRFWAEIYPNQLARDIAIGKWRQAAIAEYNGGKDIGIHAETADKILRELTLSALDNADIEIVDAEKARASPDEALAYLRELYAEVYPLGWAARAENPSDAMSIHSAPAAPSPE